ncbi:PTS sugar transporter subunit IIA [Pectinatus cerevisiiphilus]|uniref:PTS system IIA component (Gat family) n=1 Tax=Pectinatus cerevisiiphilus TaxID=86956 RepID=A0A4V2USG2_9FIRM|nr:PTS sugar transporter subunit IIA [Pectinatus cerevisiiphilus]TCS81312.1 PTS system IIA component (Gat family) [Pectinatus cerevisiiphilus]
MSAIALDEELILLNLDGKDKLEVISKMANNLQKLGYVKESYKDAIIAREKVFATGLPTSPYGVAIPHTDIEHVNKPAICVACLSQPVDFVIMGEKNEEVPVRIIFMLAMKEQHAQLGMLQKLMKILQEKGALEKIIKAHDSVDIKDFIRKRLEL